MSKKFFKLTLALFCIWLIGCTITDQSNVDSGNAFQEFFSPGNQAFTQGQQQFSNKEYKNALASFKAAIQKDPENEEYLTYFVTTQTKILEDGLKQVVELPAEAIPQKLNVLRQIRPAKIELTNVEMYPESLKEDLKILRNLAFQRRGWLEENTRNLNQILTKVTSVKENHATNPGLALEQLEDLLPYSPYITEVAEAKELLATQRGTLIQNVKTKREAGNDADAAVEIHRIAKVWPHDSEASQLAQEIEMRHQEKKEEEAAVLVGFAQEAEDAGYPAIAMAYYQQAQFVVEPSSLLVVSDQAPEHLLDLKEKLRNEKVNVAILYSESLSDEHRQRITTELAARLTPHLSIGITPLELNEAGDLEEYDFVVEVRSYNLQWKVEAVKAENVWSQYLAGYQKILNPDYLEASRKYQEVVNLSNQAAQSAIPGNALSGILSGTAQILAIAELNAAEKKLKSTPQYLEEPVYQTYQYAKQLIQEHGSISAKVGLIDVLEKQEYGVDEIIVENNHTEVEIAGAHPDDKNGVRNHTFSPDTSLVRQEQMKAEAFEKIVDKLVLLARQSQRYRAEQYFSDGRTRQGAEAMLRYAFRFSSPSEGSKEIGNNVWVNHLQGGFAGIREKQIQQEPEDKSYPTSSLVARLLTPASPIVSTSLGVPLTPEELVNQVAPSVVTVKTFLSQGSGFVFDSNGYIFTNAHVLTGARDILVEMSDGRQLIASVVSVDPRRDIAILQVQARNLPALPIRWDDSPAIGEEVLAIGAPGGLQNTVTRGIVSGVRRFGDVFADINFDPNLVMIQTDAAINPGNSGGPLVDNYGRVVGMNTFKKSENEGIGFALAANNLKDVFHSVTLQ